MKKKNETNDSSILNVHVSRHSTYSLEMESATGRDELKELCAHNTHTIFSHHTSSFFLQFFSPSLLYGRVSASLFTYNVPVGISCFEPVISYLKHFSLLPIR